MDSAVTVNIDTLLNTVWTNLYTTSTATGSNIQPAVVLGQAGASMAFFFALYGAYTAGATLVKSTENGFFTFLEDFQDNDEYINMIDDEENGKEFHDFLNGYAWYQLLLLFTAFWHIFFVITMGTSQSILLFFRIKSLDDQNSNDVDLNVGWLLFLMGMLYGVTDYLAAIGLSVNKDSLLQMTGFMSKPDDDSVITKGTYLDDSGNTVTTTEMVTQNTEVKKDFFAMYEVMNLWGSLFFFQQSLQMVLPFMYILFLETAVIMVFLMTVINYI